MFEQGGVFLVNKPIGWSSYGVVDYLKKKLKIRKIGHAGTLDPLAKGLLVVLVGKATKKFNEFQEMPKEYEARIEFGKETDTLDREGKIIFVYKKDFKLKKSDLEKELKKIKGEISQMPPIFSALKIKGKPAYRIARGGGAPKIKQRRVKIYRAKILAISSKKAKIFFKVSSGTYIRSLARDIGKSLGYYGYLFGLRRIAIGKFKLTDAMPPEKITVEDLIDL